MSPTAYTSGCPGTPRRPSTTIRPPRPSGTPSSRRHRRGGHAGGPHHRAAPGSADRRRGPRRRASTEATPTPVSTSTPRRPSTRCGGRAARRGERAEQAVGGLDEDDPGVADVEVAGSPWPARGRTARPSRRPARRRSDRRRRSTTLSAPVGGRVDVGGRLLEAGEHVLAHGEGVVERLQGERVLVDAGHAERGAHRAGGDDQRVVLQRSAGVGVHAAGGRGRCRPRGPCARPTLRWRRKMPRTG